MELDKETLQNLRNNVIKDHRRRLLYVDKKEQKGYQVLPSDLKKITTYTSRSLYALMLFLVIFGIFKQRFVFGVLAAGLVYGLLELYFNFIFLKDKNILNIRDKEFAIFDSLQAHEDKKSDAFVRIMLPLLLMVVMYSVFNEPLVNDNSIDLTLMKLMILVLPLYSLHNAFNYYKEGKIIKKMEKNQ